MIQINVRVIFFDPNSYTSFQNEIGNIQFGQNIEIIENVLLVSKSFQGKSLFEAGDIFDFTLSFPSGIAAGIIANWLYDKLKSRKCEIKIDDIEANVNVDDIERNINKAKEQSREQY